MYIDGSKALKLQHSEGKRCLGMTGLDSILCCYRRNIIIWITFPSEPVQSWELFIIIIIFFFIDLYTRKLLVTIELQYLQSYQIYIIFF